MQVGGLSVLCFSVLLFVLQLSPKGGVWERYHHTLTSHSQAPGVTEVVMYGGLDKRGTELAATTALLFGMCGTCVCN